MAFVEDYLLYYSSISVELSHVIGWILLSTNTHTHTRTHVMIKCIFCLFSWFCVTISPFSFMRWISPYVCNFVPASSTLLCSSSEVLRYSAHAFSLSLIPIMHFFFPLWRQRHQNLTVWLHNGWDPQCYGDKWMDAGSRKLSCCVSRFILNTVPHFS